MSSSFSPVVGRRRRDTAAAGSGTACGPLRLRRWCDRQHALACPRAPSELACRRHGGSMGWSSSARACRCRAQCVGFLGAGSSLLPQSRWCRDLCCGFPGVRRLGEQRRAELIGAGSPVPCSMGVASPARAAAQRWARWRAATTAVRASSSRRIGA